jgi:hypothetical protein
MELLNKNATIVFAKLIDSLQGEDYRKILNEPYMPLTLERIGLDVITEWGKADQYSLCHYYVQNGDLMKDPEMCFFAIDERNGIAADYSKVKIAPYSFESSSTGYYEASIEMEDNEVTTVNKEQQKDQTEFANDWMTNIKDQGFLNQAK